MSFPTLRPSEYVKAYGGFDYYDLIQETSAILECLAIPLIGVILQYTATHPLLEMGPVRYYYGSGTCAECWRQEGKETLQPLPRCFAGDFNVKQGESWMLSPANWAGHARCFHHYHIGVSPAMFVIPDASYVPKSIVICRQFEHAGYMSRYKVLCFTPPCVGRHVIQLSYPQQHCFVCYRKIFSLMDEAESKEKKDGSNKKEEEQKIVPVLVFCPSGDADRPDGYCVLMHEHCYYEAFDDNYYLLARTRVNTIQEVRYMFCTNTAH